LNHNKLNNNNNDIIIMIIIIQISMSLLTCRRNSTTANYEASTKTAQIHKNEALDGQNKDSTAAAGKINNMNLVLGQKKP
jgi:hypothetical protein